MVIYICTAHMKGISSCQLARDLLITQTYPGWVMFHRMREMVSPKETTSMKNFVEADITWFGGKEKNKGIKKRIQLVTGEHVPEKAPVFGIVTGTTIIP